MKNSAIYITEHLVRFVENADSPDNQKSLEIPLASRKKEEIPHLIKNLLKEHKLHPEHLILCLPRTEVSLRFLQFPSVNDNEIAQMLGLDIGNLFPYKAEELVYGHTVVEKSAEGYSRVMLAAVPLENILRLFSLLKHAGLVPDAVTLSTVSLGNQLAMQRKDQGSVAVLYFDDGFADLLCLDQGRLEFSRALPLNRPQAEEGFLNEFKATMAALSAQGLAPQKILTAGKIPSDELLKKIKAASGLDTEPVKDLDVAKKLASAEAGLKINLLPEEYRIRKVNEQRKRTLIYLAILFLLNLSLASNILFFKIKAKEEYLDAVRSEIKKIEDKAEGIQKEMLRAQELQTTLNSGRLKLGLLSEVYRAAPAGVLLNSLDISGNRGRGSIVLIGQAQDQDSVSKFNNNLKASSFIEKTDLARTTEKKVANKSMVDFEIRATF